MNGLAVPDKGADHREFIVKLQSGRYEWIDPVDDVALVESGDSGEIIIVVFDERGCRYTYHSKDVADWVVREYDGINTFPFGEHYEEREYHARSFETAQY